MTAPAKWLTFNGLGTVTPGESLAIFDWAQFVSPNYAIRFLGDLTANTSFLSLIDSTTVNGLDPIYNFDGTFTNVLTIPVPEPSTLVLAGLGALALGRAIRRRSRRSPG